MSIVGIFNRSRPSIQAQNANEGFVFDAVLEESSELITEVTTFPIENGTEGNDHISIRPLTLTMRVGVTDNAFRAAAAEAGQLGPVKNAIAGTGLGGAIGQLSQNAAVAAGLGASLANAAYAAGKAGTRSQSALEAVRDIQKAGYLLDVVTSKAAYSGVIISRTSQETTKENEGGLELVVEMVQPNIIATEVTDRAINPAINDPVETSGQEFSDQGFTNGLEVGG